MNLLQDDRTLEQMKIDYDHGMEMEQRILEYLKTLWTVYTTTDKDKRLEPSEYRPDAIIVWKKLLPVEIKYTKHDINEVHWKLNQYYAMQRRDWFLLQISWHRFCIISCTNVWPTVDGEDSYCNKPCMAFYPKRYDLSELKDLF